MKLCITWRRCFQTGSELIFCHTHAHTHSSFLTLRHDVWVSFTWLNYICIWKLFENDINLLYSRENYFFILKLNQTKADRWWWWTWLSGACQDLFYFYFFVPHTQNHAHMVKHCKLKSPLLASERWLYPNSPLRQHLVRATGQFLSIMSLPHALCPGVCDWWSSTRCHQGTDLLLSQLNLSGTQTKKNAG